MRLSTIVQWQGVSHHASLLRVTSPDLLRFYSHRSRSTSVSHITTSVCHITMGQPAMILSAISWCKQLVMSKGCPIVLWGIMAGRDWTTVRVKALVTCKVQFTLSMVGIIQSYLNPICSIWISCFKTSTSCFSSCPRIRSIMKKNGPLKLLNLKIYLAIFCI